MADDIEASFEKHRDKCSCKCPRCREWRKVERLTARLKPRDRAFLREVHRRMVHPEMSFELAGTGEN